MTSLGWSAVIGLLHELGSFGIFLRCVWKTFLGTRGNLGPILGQISYVSMRSLPTVAISGIFVGAILVLQFNLMLEQYGSQSLLGGLNTSAVIRQVGPLIISFLLAGKIGAFTAAELGTMRVTEQIDAIECLGTNPIQYLIVPRFIGIVISSVILLSMGLMVSVAGSMLVASAFCGVNPLLYASSIQKFTTLGTLAGGMFQSIVYGIIVAGVSCHKGYTASGGARGVGKAVTQAAIYTNFYIVIANFITSSLLTYIEDLLRFSGS